MGVLKMFSSNSQDRKISGPIGLGSSFREAKDIQYVQVQNNLPNPDPSNYEILRWKEYDRGRYLIVMIKYLDCVNYEGKKILVFEDCTIESLMQQKLIDPHFMEDKSIHAPIARFKPEERGWVDAEGFIEFRKKQDGA